MSEKLKIKKIKPVPSKEFSGGVCQILFPFETLTNFQKFEDIGKKLSVKIKLNHGLHQQFAEIAKSIHKINQTQRVIENLITWNEKFSVPVNEPDLFFKDKESLTRVWIAVGKDIENASIKFAERNKLKCPSFKSSFEEDLKKIYPQSIHIINERNYKVRRGITARGRGGDDGDM